MNRLSLKKKSFLIVALLYVLYTVFPLFADLISIPVWLPSLGAFVIMLLLYPQAFINKVMLWFMIYAFILTIYLIIGKPLNIGIGTVADNRKILIEFAYILPSISIFSILLYLKDNLLTRYITSFSFIILFVSFIVAYPLMNQYGSIRTAFEEEIVEAKIMGLPGYSLMHAYTLAIPALCYFVKVAKPIWRKLFSLLALAILCFMVYDTFVTTSLLIMIVLLSLTLFYRNNTQSLIILSVVIVITVVLWKLGLFASVIDWVMPAFAGTPVEPKLNDFKMMAMGESLTGGTVNARGDLHGISWNSFFTNPIVGTSVVGDHSALLDRFGGMGIIGGLPFLMIFISFVKRMKTQYQTNMAKVFFFAGVISAFVYLYEKGLWGPESWLMLMVLMPFAIYTAEQKTIYETH